MDVHKRFSLEAINQMQLDIQEADGNEVCWAARINPAGLVTEVQVGSRGNIDSVIVNEAVGRQGNVLIHNHPSGVLSPSPEDQMIAMNASDSSMGFYIVNNSVSDVYVVVEPIKPRTMERLDEDQAALYLSKDGPLAAQNPSYEERPSQIALVRDIARAFNQQKIGVFEAGTGVGKSYAYLIPSMLWAINNKERVIISTGTINLQQQLVEKDIPAAQKIIGKKIKAVLLKGRQNYLCLRRLEDARNDLDLFSEDADTITRIASWAKTTETGSRSDMAIVPGDSVWSRVNSESDACMGMRCPYRDDCFVMKVRKEASDSNLLVVNHHLLFADIESRMMGAGYDDVAVLPPYRHIVFDEAHGIEDSATSFFSESITKFKILKQVNMLYRQYRGSYGGFIVQASAVSTVEDFEGKAYEAVTQVKDDLLVLDEEAQEVMGNEYTGRLNQETEDHFSSILSAISRLRVSLGKFTSLCREVLDGIADDDKDIPCVWESKVILRRLESTVSLCKEFCEWNEHEDKVFWFQKVRLPPKSKDDEATCFVQFMQTPLDIAPLMNQGVFEPMESVVCTSATLRTGTSFSYWMRRIGISFVEEERVMQNVYESPFPYRTNVIFAVPHDAPFPDNNAAYQSYVEETLPKLIFAAGGRTLVLFTSYDSLKNAYNSCRLQFSQAGITMFKQGDDDRFRLLERFKADRESVLFATDSFWEGVDVPGDSLSQVIIVKLPFAVPNDPVFKARCESVEKKGGSSFYELSVPQAVIKFRQGFGRLIRRGDDKGVIVVLDRRIVEKGYGKQFTTSVPMSRRMYNPLNFILTQVEEFLAPGKETEPGEIIKSD